MHREERGIAGYAKDAVTARTPVTAPSQLTTLIRFALSKVSSRNAHHEFEDLCRHLAKRRIASNVLPATGPVGAGGDQGRDFETFRTFLRDEIPSSRGFLARAANSTIAFACTAQAEDVEHKFRADLKAICTQGTHVDHVVLMATGDLPVAARHRLQTLARDTYMVELDVLDGQAIAELLTDNDLLWIAEQYLHLSTGPRVPTLLDEPSHRPYQLPRDPDILVGRQADIDQGLQWLRGEGAEADHGGLGVVVTGPPGIGKTAVAVRLARCAADDFPDGQIFITAPPESEPGGANLLAELLEALEPEPTSSSGERSQQLARLRFILARRKILIVIDDFVSEASLRELLAIDGSFAVVCTSLARLSGLADCGMLFIELGPLANDDAATLARGIAKARLTVPESHELAAACGGFPLAVRIAASQIARRRHLKVADYLQELSNPDLGLDALTAGQRSMAAIIAQSYQSLNADQATMLEALGLLPNVAVTVDILAAAIAGDGSEAASGREAWPGFLRAARRRVDELHELSLIEQLDADRFRLHGLLYRYARGKAPRRDQAWREVVMVNACLVYAIRAREAISAIGLAPPEARAPAKSNQRVIDELEADRPGYVGMVELASQARLWDPLVVLAVEITPALRLRGHWSDMQRVYQCVLVAGEQAANDEWRATALHNLGLASAHLGETEAAVELYQQCERVAVSADDVFMTYAAREAYGTLLMNIGQPELSIPLLRGSLRAWRLLGNDALLAQTLEKLGSAYLMAGKWDRAETYLRNAQHVAERGDADAANAKLSLALSDLFRVTGRIEQAEQSCRAALDRARAIGHREQEAVALLELGLIQQQPEAHGSPTDSFHGALTIFREISDASGQVRCLQLLGVEAIARGRIKLAIGYLVECATLAEQIGDSARGAAAMANLAAIGSGMGQYDQAQALFRHARELAEATGSGVVLAEVLEQHARLFVVTGQLEQAINVLREAAGLLEATSNRDALAIVRIALGDALMRNNQWPEAAGMLRAVSEVPPDIIRPGTRASALRVLAGLYSRRRLWEEALQAAKQSLTLAQKHGAANVELHCRVTLGNVLARMGRRPEALAEYEVAAEAAEAIYDTNVLTAVRANQAACRLADNADGSSTTEARQLIEVIGGLGQPELEATLRLNLGSSLAQQGSLEEAIREFDKSRLIAESIGDENLSGVAARNLAMAHRSKGEDGEAHDLAREAVGLFESHGDWVAAADAMLLELEAARELSESTALTAVVVSQAVAARGGVRRGTAAALGSRLRTVPGAIEAPAADEPVAEAQSGTFGRAIHVADEIRRELPDIDLDSVAARLAGSRQRCCLCQLPIARRGRAELLLLRPPSRHPPAIRLAHPACSPSTIISSPAIRQNNKIRFEIECGISPLERATVLIDCHGAFDTDRDGKILDVWLTFLRRIGFVDIAAIEVPESGDEESRTLPQPSALTACLIGNRLTLQFNGADLLAKHPLSFLPRWYRAARKGQLNVLFGRDLEGMAWEDPSNLIRAAETGQLVGATVKLKVSLPGRNERCICSPRTGLKFKKCCGRHAGQDAS